MNFNTDIVAAACFISNNVVKKVPPLSVLQKIPVIVASAKIMPHFLRDCSRMNCDKTKETCVLFLLILVFLLLFIVVVYFHIIILYLWQHHSFYQLWFP